MASKLITHYLGGYFEMFIKDFQPDQFDVALTKGTATMSNVFLKESIVQDLLKLPENISVEEAYVDEIKVKVPSVLELSKKPLNLSISKIKLVLTETDKKREISTLKGLSKLSSEKSKANADLLKKIFSDIDSIEVIVKPLNTDSALHVNLFNTQLRTTNENWEVVENLKSLKKNKKAPTTTVYKSLICEKIEILVKNKSDIYYILEPIKLVTLFSLEFDKKINEFTEFNGKAIFPDGITCIWTEESWNEITTCLTLLQRATTKTALDEHPVLETTQITNQSELNNSNENKLTDSNNLSSSQTITKDVANLESAIETLRQIQFSFSIITSNISISIKVKSKKEDKELTTYEIVGNDFELSFCPNRLKTQDSILELSLLNVMCRRLGDSPICALYRDTNFITKNNSQQPSHLLKLLIRHSWNKDAPETDFDLRIDGLHVILDGNVWYTMNHFLEARNQNVINIEQTSQILLTEQRRFTSILNHLRKICFQDNNSLISWFNRSKIQLTITNTAIEFPAASFQSNTHKFSDNLVMRVGSMQLANNALWSNVPDIADALKELKSSYVRSHPRQPTQSTPQSKIQLSLEAIHFEFNSEQPQRIVEPFNIELASRFLGRELATDAEKLNLKNNNTQLEISINVSPVKVHLTSQQNVAAIAIFETLKSWTKKSNANNKLTEDAQKQIQSSIEQIVKEVAIEVDSRSESIIKSVIEGDGLKAAETTFQSVVVAFVLHARRGEFSVPFHQIGAELNELQNTEHSNDLTKIEFDNLFIVLESSPEAQCGIASIKKIEAENITHKSLLSNLFLKSIDNNNSQLSKNISIEIERIIHPKQNQIKNQLILLVTLNAMKVISKAMKSLDSKQVAGIADDVQKLVNNAVTGITDNKDSLDKGLTEFKKYLDYFKIQSQINVRNCQGLLFDAENDIHTGIPYATISLSEKTDTNELEVLRNDFAQRMVNLTESENDKLQLQEQLREAQLKEKQLIEQFSVKEKKLIDELDDAMQQLVLAKMQVAEMKSQLK
eukprot:TRINITY_DN7541_c0_g1_i1.p1 TRINITY_DN7541_c0_g1~~TRINITY_DN7541_c0_g1_i1.p1  ORF type:complete len:1015 (+),score=479.22 TRINITY_DN7541_c0_g1_i1:58-3102(+)